MITYGLLIAVGAAGSTSLAATPANVAAAAKAKGPAPPPPKPKPTRLSGNAVAETVTALYDYEAQAHGDLSFSAGEVIEIVRRTNNDNEWWYGKVNGKEGQFPGKLSIVLIQVIPYLLTGDVIGNYVKLNH